MIQVTHINTYNFDNAVRGMRNPLQSWDKSDSKYFYADGMKRFAIGDNDIELMHRLYKAGTEHRKFLRQIFISMDITAPDYWFKEFSTYKVGVVENSTSTMHRILSKAFEKSDFSFDYDNLNTFDSYNTEVLIDYLEDLRKRCVEEECTKEEHWRLLIQSLPMSYNYKRTVTMNYENAITMINQRENHKLQEWKTFTDILKKLPYMTEIRGEM